MRRLQAKSGNAKALRRYHGWQTLKDFVKKITGMKSTEADRIRRAEQLYRKALEEAGMKISKKS